ncbi:MAG: hypothetical protein HEQ40_14635 [Lacibacter sp.]|jgi:hypothetical protein|nr:hypothetical protein [Planktothrix agardhii]
MKKSFTLLLIFGVLLTACRKKTEPPTVTSVLVSREWKVGFARDFSANYTVLYTGMKFTFTADGKLKVNDGTTVYDGTWSENPVTETITMDIISPLFELDFVSREWQVSSSSFTGVNLKDDKAATTQELRFAVWQ